MFSFDPLWRTPQAAPFIAGIRISIFGSLVRQLTADGLISEHIRKRKTEEAHKLPYFSQRPIEFGLTRLCDLLVEGGGCFSQFLVSRQGLFLVIKLAALEPVGDRVVLCGCPGVTHAGFVA
jgi:hypothetical protein